VNAADVDQVAADLLACGEHDEKAAEPGALDQALGRVGDHLAGMGIDLGDPAQREVTLRLIAAIDHAAARVDLSKVTAVGMPPETATRLLIATRWCGIAIARAHVGNIFEHLQPSDLTEEGR